MLDSNFWAHSSDFLGKKGSLIVEYPIPSVGRNSQLLRDSLELKWGLAECTLMQDSLNCNPFRDICHGFALKGPLISNHKLSTQKANPAP